MTSKTHRTTITLPHDLKKRMDAVREQVNWSATAAAAFEAKLLEIESRKDVKTMKETIERLKASKRKEEEEMLKLGREAGLEWAMKKAEYIDLERLANHKVRSAFDGEDFFAEIRYEDWKQGRKADAFWESVLGDSAYRAESNSFIQGFIAGALEVWNDVKEQL
jgi:hypothetical protein